uniref:PP4R3 EVH1-like domain-containing protein n=1 Tax=Acrobeloides nanus TaxID=290746 RepID=A0A914DH55_9BILA
MTEETSVITDLKRSENEEENTSNLSENDGSQAEEPNRSALEAEPSDASNINGEDGSRTSLDKIKFIRDAHNRVKLYVLCDQRAWDDRGTGHVAFVPMPDYPGSWCIVVRLEDNERNVLESKILLDTIYQKQQGTLIVWSESDTCDLALSFQEKSGCEEIWDKICRVQGKDPYASANYDDDQQIATQKYKSFKNKYSVGK